MPQDPLLVDQISVEPGASGTRLINRAADGSLQLSDPVTGTVTLAQVAGLGSITGVFVVGQSGQYTDIQTAIDAVPSGASASNPYLILVMPGVYTEDVSLYRDGVYLVGLGGVTLESALESTPDAVGAGSTLTIEAGGGTIPLNVVVKNLTITNAHQNFAAVRIEGGAGSTVGTGSIRIEDCTLQATSTLSNRPLWASSVNNVVWKGGSCEGSHGTALALVEEVASLTVDGVSNLTAMQLDYDSGGTLPSVAGSAYKILSCDALGADSTLPTVFSSELVGQGSLRVTGCDSGPDMTFAGDRSFVLSSSRVGDLTLSDTVAVSLYNTPVGTVTSASGTTLRQTPVSGTEAFAAATSVSVTLGTPQPDNSYNVLLTVDAATASTEVPWVSSKTASGFDINFTSAQTLNVTWTLIRTD